jgi:tetratricopeptide (TPR) repeat protein
LADDNPFKYGLEAWTIVLKVSLSLSDDNDADLKEALSLAKQSIQLAPGLPDGHSLKAYIEGVFFGDFENTVLSADKVLEIGQNSMDAMAIAANIYRGAGQLEKSASTYEKIINIAPYAPTWIQMHYVRTLLVLDRLDTAEKLVLPPIEYEHLRKDVKSNALLTLAYIYLMKGNSDKAQSFFDLQAEEFLKASAQTVRDRWLTAVDGPFVNEFVSELNKLGLKDKSLEVSGKNKVFQKIN